MSVVSPIIISLFDDEKSLKNLYNSLDKENKENDLIKNYPTVYIHCWKKNDKFEVYVGESNNFFQRTEQHYEQIDNPNSWQKNIKGKDAKLYVIAHPKFNKSLTLDVENKLIHYLSSSRSILKVHNGRGNPQNKYYSSEDFNEIFNKIWRKLRKENPDLFLSESEIKDSAIYKASPLHKLNDEQLELKSLVIDNISKCLQNNRNGQLILVEGNAGTGKTVLMSSIFYELIRKFQIEIENSNINNQDIESAILVNHDEQLAVYKQIVKKLDLVKDNKNNVFIPTTFINMFYNKTNSPKKRDKEYDVVFVDEAHLLMTRKNQSYTEDCNQLDEILKHAKVVVAMFDRYQILSAENYLSQEDIKRYVSLSKENNTYLKLDQQMRMKGLTPELQNWFNNIIRNDIIEKIPDNKGNYEIKVFNDPKKLENEIKKKASNEKTKLSRIVATYDWEYVLAKGPDKDKVWTVKIGDWEKPWNFELGRLADKNIKKLYKKYSWSENPITIDEIGSTFTIQGFDLNYVGVIIGPSVKYREGKIVYDPYLSHNKKAKEKRKLKDGSKESFGKQFIKNELGVLLTRGINGLYIYAVDDELRNYLNQMI